MRVRHLRIPKERVGSAIGPDGEVKKQLEDKSGAEISFDSETGEVEIKATDENPLKALTVRDVIKAIGRGFSPERALTLFNNDMYLEIIDITSYASSDKAKSRLKGRVIGREGKTRKAIEENAEVYVSIYGKTIGIIGGPDRLQIAREAILMLLDGAPHAAVYNFLEEKGREIKNSPDLWRK
ncbi:MAG: RNA-processing protein [Hadesarchaea archaeon]|nr:RNA-processing protein [Hadesarchaea archaeon]